MNTPAARALLPLLRAVMAVLVLGLCTSRRAHAQVEAPSGLLNAGEVRAVLMEAAALVRTRHSYAVLRGFDADAVFNEAAERVAGRAMSPAEVAELIEALLSPIGDCHLSVRAEGWPVRGPWLGCELRVVDPRRGGRVVALRADLESFLDPDFPFVEALDGAPLSACAGVVARHVQRGSPQFHWPRCISRLHAPTLWRAGVAVEPADRNECQITLSNGAGATRVVAVPLVKDRVQVSPPKLEVRVLEGGVGYVRLGVMDPDPEALAQLDEGLASMKAARGLIIDVRGNGGGTRHALGVVARHLLSRDVPPIVFNAARLLRLPGESKAQLEARMEDRLLFPGNHAIWTPQERQAIEQFVLTFAPEVQFPEERFSPWHFGVVSAAGLGGEHADPAVEPFDGPVVVLMDERCLSATDIFLAAVKEFPGVVLMGTASGGASGQPMAATLAGGRIQVRLSSMVSFRPDGLLIEGRGVDPDVEVVRAPTDGIGGRDSVLEAAVEYLVSPSDGGR